MKYLSWDVGIANLAYCLISKEVVDGANLASVPLDESNFKIIKWGVINLKDADHPCSELDNKHKLCKKKATLCGNINNTTYYYCKTHSKKFISLPVLVSDIPAKDSAKCIHNIHNTKTNTDKLCNKKALHWLDKPENTYCKTHMASHTKIIKAANSLKSIHKTNANKIPMNILSIKLFTILNNIPEFLDVDEVLIENQPTLKNPTMKTISSLLFSYFILKGIVEKPNNKISHVKFICPSNKLKVSSNATNKLQGMKSPTVEDDLSAEDELRDTAPDVKSDKLKSDNSRQIYIMTKKMGILFTKELLKNDITNLTLLSSTNKQDDMCDAFLQAYYYIFCRQTISPSVQLILDNLNKLSNNMNKSDSGSGLDASAYV
jgi:hypothetical protein